MTHDPTPRLLHDLFARAAGAFAQQVAIEVPPGEGREGSAAITFAQLDAEAGRVRDLVAPLVRGECVVAIFLPQSSPLVYAAQLGVLRAGAAFVCLDVAFPSDHVRFVLEDSGAVAALTDQSGERRLLGGPLAPEKILDAAAEPAPADAKPQREPYWLSERSLAYVIYTSGTTGRPKGVMVEHGSVVHLIEEELKYLGLTATDRCVQVSSPAYDSSIEESWLPLAAGATIIVADADVVRLGPDLVPWLRDVRATLLMPTPTLLRMTACADPAQELPELRIVYVGGEAVPPDIVNKWAPGRRFENGYGPTECTVTITRGRLLPGHPITIGKVIEGNASWILDAELRPVQEGHEGELCISGPQVARGYLGRPELTAERFPDAPGIGRVYRTGDVVQSNQDGDLLYLGRADTQVKVRGYRIELEAIEASMAALPKVAAAACRAMRTAGGQDQLEAFFVPQDPAAPPPAEEILGALRSALPSYMVPSRIQALDKLPTTTSGKLDRRALPEIQAAEGATATGTAPRNGLEASIAAALASPLGLMGFDIDADYFDLGGDSLGVATAISILRGAPETAGLGARDVYEHRTVRGLAEHLLRTPAHGTGHGTGEPRDVRIGARKGAMPLSVTAVQLVWLLTELAAATWAGYALAFLAAPLLLDALGVAPLLLLSPFLATVALTLYAPVALGFAVLTKRLLIGKYAARRAPVWGGFYLRHWIVQRTVRLFPWGFLQGTVFYGAVLRALGAKVGSRVHIHRGVDLLRGGWDLLTIGDDVTLCQDSSLDLVHLEDGELVIGPVTLEAGSTLEVRSGVGEHTTIGEGAELSALSYLSRGSVMEPHTRYDGVPAEALGPAPPLASLADSRPMDPAAHGVLLIALRAVLGLVFALPVMGAVTALLWAFDVGPERIVDWINGPAKSPTALLLLVAGAGLSLVPLLTATALLLRWTPSTPIGPMGRWSVRYAWLWIRSGLMTTAGTWLAGSLFWRWWLGLAGMKMGRNCEVSSIIDVVPEHVTIGDESFFADGIYLAGPRIRRSVVETGRAEFGERVFLGNHVVIDPGTRLPSDVLLGVSTRVDPAEVRPGSSWFGHPPFKLPRREVRECDRKLTHEPPFWLYVHRLAWELLRLGIPSVLAASTLVWLQLASVLGAALAPVATAAILFGLAALVCATKWTLLGRVRPGQHGFWSTWCCRWDFVYVAWGMIARGALSPLGGTLLLPWYLRAMGVRVGKRAVLGGEFAQVVDPDMLEFGDDTTIDRPLFQAHSFEDRVLKIGRVRVGAGATIRRATVLFYGSQLEPGSQVAPHSVVMKNEKLSRGRRYRGVPTRPSDWG